MPEPEPRTIADPTSPDPNATGFEVASVVRLRDPDAAAKPSPEGSPTARTGRYQLLGELGHGGMGVVLHGHDPALGRDLAIKVLLQRFTKRPDIMQRFREEAQVAGQLQHPGVVPVYELGALADGQPYFTMKLVKGTTLTVLLRQRQHPAQDRPRLLKVFEQVCQAVAYAHSKGVIHRDLKPDNVMVGRFGEVQVMDWGLAKVLPAVRGNGADTTSAGHDPQTTRPSVVQVARPESTSSGTQTGDVLGTPAYMAPEQALGEVELLDERTDVFSLGALLCEILTEKPPYTGGDSPLLLRRARRADLADAFARLEGCGADPELIDLARRCLAPEPAGRPANAEEVARTVEAHRIGVEERARRAELERAAALARAEEARATSHEAEQRAAAERRARRLTLALAAATLLLVVAGGSGAWLLQQQRAAAHFRRDRANEKARLAMASARELLDQGWEKDDAAKLAAALAEADKAVKIADSGSASDDVREAAGELRLQADAKVKEARRNAALLAALLDVTAPRETGRYQRDESGRVVAVAEPSPDERFAEAFRRWGLDIDRTPFEEASSRLGRQPPRVVQEIVAGLDTWMLYRRFRKQPETRWRLLLRLADKLDGDKDSRALRRLLSSGELEQETLVNTLTGALLPWAALADAHRGKRTQWLRQRAASVRVHGPVLGLVTLARALEAVEAREAERLLRRAVTARPEEVVLLNELGGLLERAQPPRWAEAIECYRAARARRPLLGIALGKALRDAGRAVEAEAVFRDLKERQPTNPELPYYVGTALDRQKKYAAAEAAYRESLALTPDAPAALYNLGGVLRTQKRYGEAEAAYRKALARWPNFVEAHHNLSIVLRKQQKYAAAETACRKALALRPNSAEIHNNLGAALAAQHKHAAAEAAYRKAIALRPNYPDAYANLARDLRSQRKYAASEEAYHQALALRPNLPEAHLGLGILLRELHRLPEAEAAFRKAIALRPRDARAHNNLGITLSEQGRHKEAEAACRQALALQPDDAVAHLNLSIALSGQQKYGEAEEACRQALALQPCLPEAHNNLGVVLDARTRYAEAEAAHRRALALRFDYPDAHLNLRKVLSARKRYVEAVEAGRQALALWPNDPRMHVSLGNALNEQKKYTEAEAAYRRAIDLEPDDSLTHTNLGVVLVNQGRHKEAEAAFRKALELQANSPNALFGLGQALRYQWKLEAAVAALRQADRLLPRNSVIGKALEEAKQLLRQDARLAAIRAGKAQPRDVQERIDLALFCGGYRKEYAAAVGLLADAFAADPQRAADLRNPDRYFGARYAALAAAGKGADAGKLNDKERVRLRQQALDWLRADLDVLTALPDTAGIRRGVRKRLTFWLEEADLAGVRDEKSLAGLPEAERKEWRKLWADVRALLKKVEDK